jgi:predicted DNA-binding transcriptional regulator AlpA
MTVTGHRVLKDEEAAQRAGVHKRTWQRLRRAGKGPRRIQISDRCSGTLEADFDDWLESRREPAPAVHATRESSSPSVPSEEPQQAA